MGFSNKRHKTDKSRERDSKKRHHRSRSRSHSLDRDKNDKHKHHKKHKKRDRKDYDSDVESVDAPPPPKISKTSHHASPPPPPEISRSRSPSPKKEGSQASLSIEETNKLRAKLGLKPLQVDSECQDKDGKKEEGKYKDDYGEFYHKPAQNVAEKQRSDKIKERLADHKQKRQIESSLAKVKTLGESDSDDDAKAWVEKSRKLAEEKKKAEERAKMLDQMDEEFGVGSLVEEEVRNERRRAYRDKDLLGLKVEHDIETFEEGNQVILTLKDQDILEGTDDVLVNVNMKDDERYKKNVEIKSKKGNFYANEDDDEMDEDEDPSTNILNKYNEEISGKKEKGFVLGAAVVEKRKTKLQELKESLENKMEVSLDYSDPRVASEYYDASELAKFKKVKKKVRKNQRTNRVLKADDLVTDNNDYLRDLGSRRRKRGPEMKKEQELETDDIEAPPSDLSNVKVDYEERDVASSKKRLKKTKAMSFDKVSQIVKQEPDVLPELNRPGNIVLDSTAEFCRTLGEIPTYGLAGNREDNDQDMMDFEQAPDLKIEEEMDMDESDGRGTWNTVLADKKQSQPVAAEATILDEEPLLDQGVGGALKLALSKGYLQKEDTNRPSASRFAHLQAQNYSIEDKSYGDDDKFGRRDRFAGPSSDFKEKSGYKPNVKLDYIDDDGHVLNAKEAFRYLSHKFHGKGPGKNKVEKRMKKAEQQVLMKRMSSTDTPLGTLTLLQAKQKETQSPFIVLSGSKQMQATTISKTKH